MSTTDNKTGNAAKGRALLITTTLGAASLALYLLLFHYADLLSELATATRQGDKIYVLVPMVIAFLFSLVHGAFTGHFWDVIGLKAKGK